MVSRAQTEDLLHKLRLLINEHGWAVQGVFPRADDPDPEPPWCYTIGLWATFRHPEMLLSGMQPELAQSILNTAGFLVKDGRVFKAGETYSDVIQGRDDAALDVAVRSISRLKFKPWFNVARAYYGPIKFEALEIVWPDSNNRFPWDREFDQRLTGRQLLIGH